jgi:cytochrome c oxidase cbb3-type subunit 3
MSDMPNEFWGGWIAVITAVSFVGLAWLIVSIYFTDTGPQEAETEVWDENLREGANPAPLWWFWMILILMVFSVGYLMLYPGLGAFRGVLNWSQASHVQHTSDEYEARFGDMRRTIVAAPLGELQRDAQVMQSAQRVYDRNCAVCHGYDAAGQAATFPNLTDAAWQWGGSPEQIEQSIRNGRSAVMVAWESTLGEQGVAEVVEYVLAMAGGSESTGLPGHSRYNQFCIGCHGSAGEGNPVLGAPSLVDGDWLYGGNEEAVRLSVARGRNGIMPAFGQRLDDAQVRMLVAWLTRPER